MQDLLIVYRTDLEHVFALEYIVQLPGVCNIFFSNYRLKVNCHLGVFADPDSGFFKEKCTGRSQGSRSVVNKIH